MKVNHSIILNYRPCADGYGDFKAKHPEFNGTLEELLMLDDISYSNKIWLACKMLDEKTLQQWSVECSYMVLNNFERSFPKDKRVRECLETVTKVINGELDKSAAWSAAWSAESAAWSAAESAAWSAAESAAWSAAESAAWSAAWSAGSAAGSAAESAESAAWSAGSAAWSAAWSAGSAAGSAAEKEQEDFNLSILIALVSNL